MEIKAEITIGEYSYIVRDIDAVEGSYIATRLVNKLRQVIANESSKSSEEVKNEVSKEEAVRGTISLIVMNLNEDEYKNVQKVALSLVDRLEKTGERFVPVPITRDGKIVHPDLRSNMSAIMQLTLESLYYNFQSFFSENGLKLVMTGRV